MSGLERVPPDFPRMMIILTEERGHECDYNMNRLQCFYFLVHRRSKREKGRKKRIKIK